MNDSTIGMEEVNLVISRDAHTNHFPNRIEHFSNATNFKMEIPKVQSTI